MSVVDHQYHNVNYDPQHKKLCQNVCSDAYTVSVTDDDALFCHKFTLNLSCNK